MPKYNHVLVEIQDKVGVVRLNRPEALNTITSEMLTEIMDALTTLDGDEQVGALVLTGTEKAFAAGADIKEMADATQQQMVTLDRISQFDRIMQVSKPVVAAVTGWCLGGGCELALSCDMIVAGKNAVFGQPEINLGIMPGAGGTQRLTHTVGKAMAMEMTLLGRRLNAEEAYRFGLVNKVVPKEECLTEAIKIAGKIADQPPVAVRLTKKMVNQALEVPLSQGLADERKTFYSLFDTEDQKEGMHAFMEKRQPVWKGK